MNLKFKYNASFFLKEAFELHMIRLSCLDIIITNGDFHIACTNK